LAEYLVIKISVIFAALWFVDLFPIVCVLSFSVWKEASRLMKYPTALVAAWAF
jgi:hypothetical protein